MDREKLLRQLSETESVGQTAYTVRNREAVVRLIKMLLALLYPSFFAYERKSREDILEELAAVLPRELAAALTAGGRDAAEADALAESFLEKLPGILALLDKDAQAIYEGDPAAVSTEEVVFTYPGFYAIAIFRLAHVFFEMGVPIIPRIMTEYAHAKTGIDIHPGAVIGEYFCIDHGTGIVIGETAVLGEHVKLYQGVTIGARSFEKDPDGNPVKGGKRHPTLGDHVVIYANATILGGDTFIGDGAVIGSSVWITRSVPAYSIVSLPK